MQRRLHQKSEAARPQHRHRLIANDGSRTSRSITNPCGLTLSRVIHGAGLERPIYLPRELTGLGQVSEMDGFDMIAQHHPQLHHQQLHLQQVHKIQMHHGTRSQMHGATIRVHGSTGKVGTPMITRIGRNTSLEMVMSLSGMERKSIELSILGKSISGQRLQE